MNRMTVFYRMEAVILLTADFHPSTLLTFLRLPNGIQMDTIFSNHLFARTGKNKALSFTLRRKLSITPQLFVHVQA